MLVDYMIAAWASTQALLLFWDAVTLNGWLNGLSVLERM